MKFIVFIAALIPDYENVLCSALLNEGFAVKSAELTGKVCINNDSSCLFSLQIDVDKKITIDEFYSTIYKLLSDNNIKYHNIIIINGLSYSIKWSIGNIDFQTKETDKE